MTQAHPYTLTVTRNTASDDPFAVLHWALRQAQAENALNEVTHAEGLTHEEAGYYYYKHEDDFIDLVVWTISLDDMLDIKQVLTGRYGWSEDTVHIETWPRGEAKP